MQPNPMPTGLKWGLGISAAVIALGGTFWLLRRWAVGSDFCPRGIVCVGGTNDVLVGSAVYAMQQENFPHEVVPIEVMAARGLWILPDEELAYQVVDAKTGEKHEYASSLTPEMDEMLVQAMHRAVGT